MTKSVWVIVVTAIVALGSLGCVTRPTLQLHTATIRSAMPQGVGLDLYMKVNNDNGFDVQIRNVRADVLLEDRYRLPPLQFNPNQWLPAYKTTLLRVPMFIPWQLVPRILAASVGSSGLRYRVVGFADVTATRLLAIKRNDYRLEEEGEVPRLALVTAARRGAR